MMRVKRSKPQVVRAQVRELLQRSSSFVALSADRRKDLGRDTVSVARFLSDGNGLTSEFGLRLTEVRDGSKVAISLISRVDFPGFVAGLIHGVFGAIVNCSMQQIEVYGELIAGVAKQIDEFLNDNKNQGDDYLVHRWPNWFFASREGKLTLRATSRAAALKEILAALTPEKSPARPSLASIRKAARQTVAFERQQTLLRDLDEGIQRLAAHPRDGATRIELTRAAIAYPGVYVEELPSGVKPIEGVSTSTAGFVGLTARNTAGANAAVVTSWREFEQVFGGPFEPSPSQLGHQFLPHGVRGFFANGGARAYIAAINSTPSETITDTHYIGANDTPMGLAALAQIDDIQMLVAPGVTSDAVIEAMVAQCEARRDRIAILDRPLDFAYPWTTPVDSSFAVAYWPWLSVDNGFGRMIAVPPSGFVAGQFARLAAHLASKNEAIVGALGLSKPLNDTERSKLAEARVNTLRVLPGQQAPLVWGVRALSSDPEWRYIFLRRYTIYLEQAISKGLQWSVFERNAEPLWQTVTRQVADFLYAEWRNGSLLGNKPEQAFFVKCDRTTMTQSDIENGRLIVLIGIAPIRPAEFVILRIVQAAAP